MDEARATERVRQARCRAKKKAAAQGGAGPPSSPELPQEIDTQLERALDMAEATPRPSRVALREALRALVRSSAAMVGAGA